MHLVGKWLPVAVVATTLAACGGGGTAAPASSTAAAPSSAAASSAPAKPAASPSSASAKPAASSPAASTASSTAASAKPAASGASAGASSAAAAASGSAAGGAIPSIPAGTKVKITTATGVPSVVFTPVWLAADNGLFAKYGLDVTVTENLEGVSQAQAIVAGDVQIGNVGGAEILNSVVAGAPMEALMQTTASPLFELHAPPSVTDPKQLKGKIVAVTKAGSSTDIAARLMLSNAGLKPGVDVKILDSGGMSGILAAMVSKQVQAGVVSPPTTIKANKAGFPTLISAVKEHLPMQNNLVATMKPYAAKHPEVVDAYLRAMLDADQMFLDQPALAVKAIAKHTKSDQATAQGAYDALKPALDPKGIVDPAGLKTVQQFGGNPKTQTLTLSDAYDNQFLQRIEGQK